MTGEAALTSPPLGPTELGGAPVPDAVAAGDSRIVKTATIHASVEDGDLAEAHQAAVDAVSAAGGWVQSAQTSKAGAKFTFKVPVGHLDGVLGELRRIGAVSSESVSGQDVTGEYVDLEARLRHWRAQEAVFVKLMADARTIAETIQIRQQLSGIQEQIEQLEGRRRQLEGQAAFSTVNLNVDVEGAAPGGPDEPARSTLAVAWERAMGAALGVLAGTLVALGVAVPLAGVVGVPALAVVALRRRGRAAGVPAVP